MKRYFDKLIAECGCRWNEFWFAPIQHDVLARVRPLVCALAAIWLLVSMANTTWWFGPNGWSSISMARTLCVASEGTWASQFHISPLWSTSAPIVFQVWSVCGVVLAVLAALGLGGRIVMLGLFAAVLFLTQRLTWTSGALEPLLVAMLGYLVIDPGSSLVKRERATTDHAPNGQRPTLTLATRLIQFHVWLLVAAGAASQLSSLPWWRGDAAWWLAVTGHSQVFTRELLRNHILLINALTHAVLICGVISLAALWSRLLRPIGVVCGCVLGLGYALLGDQTLYGLLLISGLLSFWPGEGSEQ
ncbi:MAG: hypothetical protein ACTHK7_19640 [Aureliella sp.]